MGFPVPKGTKGLPPGWEKYYEYLTNAEAVQFYQGNICGFEKIQVRVQSLGHPRDLQTDKAIIDATKKMEHFKALPPEQMAKPEIVSIKGRDLLYACKI